MSLPGLICACLFLLSSSLLLWCQNENASRVDAAQERQDSSMESQSSDIPTSHPEDRMLTPPPAGTLSFPLGFSSAERPNYLRYGVVFTTAYTDNALFGISQALVSDVSYSVAPTIGIDETTSRLHWVATYAPGFTFYQRISERNESDHNMSLQLTYRLSPHVVLSAEDHFQKSSNVFNTPNVDSSFIISGATQVPNFALIPPTADRLTNTGSVGLAYQYSLNQMVGGTGMLTRLDYPNPSQAPGLFNSNTQAGSAFYSCRISKIHYIGATYQYQRLVSYPTEAQTETQTHAAILFYTLHPSAQFSISFFGGPQYSDTVLPPFPPSQPVQSQAKSWDPAAGASMSWQGQHTNVALSYARVIAGGGGLVGAVHTESGSAALQRQLVRHLSAAIGGGYAQNRVIANVTSGGQNGHSIFGTASLEQQFGEHLSFQVGYSRTHQTYSQIPILASNPDANREFVSIAYQFKRPLGR